MAEEIEAKFFLNEPAMLRAKLLALGAELLEPRVYELNLRFDTPSMSLSAEKKVLRLRKDRRSRLTFKTPGTLKEGVLVRPEFEIEVSDFEECRRILEGLGYQVFSAYEKYRETFSWYGLMIMMDEMPFGHFVEIEGQNPKAVRILADKLGLAWEKRFLLSYMAIFDALKAKRGLAFNDLSFENFKDLRITEAELLSL